MSGAASHGADVEESSPSLWRDAWRRFCRNRLALISLVFLAVSAVMCFGAPWLAPFPYDRQNLGLGAVAPQGAHWLGTDILGRDLFSRMLYGGRISLAVGILATLVSLSIGVLYGALAGYVGGRLDSLMMRFVDVLYAVPFTILVILLMVVFGRHFVLLFLAIGAVEWLTMARIVRAQIMALKQQEFVEAARALGLRNRTILLRHMIPNTLGPVLVYGTMTIPMVMLLEAFLSFLGLGVPPPMSSWGVLIKEGAEVMDDYPWLLVFPGLAFSITLMALNFVGDGLRDAVDTRAARD